MSRNIEINKIETDLIIIGGAGAGLCAGMSALSRGLSTTIISKMPAAGMSSTYLAAGYITRSDDRSADELFRRMIHVGGSINDQRLVERFVSEVPSRVDALSAFGIELEPLPPVVPGEPGQFRIVRRKGTTWGGAMMSPVRRAFESRGGTIIDGATAVDLFFDSSGRQICGVVAVADDGTVIIASAGSVLLACGGGAAIFRRSDNPPGTTGDGIAMAFRAGADLVNIECISLNMRRESLMEMLSSGEITPEEKNRGNAHYFLGGVRIDESGGTSVPGLFAAGEVTGGLFGAGRLGGSAVADIIVFGGIAGESAADFSKSAGRPKPDQGQIDQILVEIDSALSAPSDDAQSFHDEMRQILWDNMGLAKTRESLERGRNALEEMTGEIARLSCSPKTLRTWAEARNVHLLGRLIATASIWREESRSNFWRLDFPKPDNSRWIKNSVLSLKNGEIVLSEMPTPMTREIDLSEPPIGAGCF